MLLPCARADVFAIASQILQRNADGRREETGFTDWYVDHSGVRALPRAGARRTPSARPHLCASGGAALFRTAPLRRYLPASRCYDPFYWEDVEWGVRAWRDGLRVLFCPRSRATHAHRATTARFYAERRARAHRRAQPAAVRRAARRVRLRRARLADGARSCDLPYASQRELARCGSAAGVFRPRLARARPPQPSATAATVRSVGRSGHRARRRSSYSFRLRAADGRAPAAAAPAARHAVRRLSAAPRRRAARRRAGARPASRLRHRRSSATRPSLYDARSFAPISTASARSIWCSARKMPQRPRRRCSARACARIATRAGRCRRDAPCAELPAGSSSQVEHAELAALVRYRAPGARWVLDLHDAYGPADFGSADDAAAAFEAGLPGARTTRVIVCSDEDARAASAPAHRLSCPTAARSPLRRVRAVGREHACCSSGPFRYAPNREGILRFLARRLAGDPRGASGRHAARSWAATSIRQYDAADAAAFAQAGVEVAGASRRRAGALLRASTLTINPLPAIRGSAVKLVESLARRPRVRQHRATARAGSRRAALPGSSRCPTSRRWPRRSSRCSTMPCSAHRARRRRSRARCGDFQWERSAERAAQASTTTCCAEA